MPPHTTKSKDNNQYKNNKHPELPENRTGWKSDNQGVKEETPRRVEGAESGSWGGEDVWQGSSRRTRVGKPPGLQSRWSHILVQMSREELGSGTDRTTQGSSVGK